ncbi:MAG: YgjP-like metallopeptidase domain-containing protein, partial [Rubrivivax sp.]
MSRWSAPWKSLQRSLFDEPDDAVAQPFAADVPALLPDIVAVAEAAAPSGLPGEIFSHPRAQREVRLDGHRVAYDMRRARRRSIGFVIGEEGLTVSVPRWVGARELNAALQEKRGWILRKLREQRERAARQLSARVDWRDGTGIPFLGETVILVLDARATGVVLDNDAADDGLPG